MREVTGDLLQFARDGKCDVIIHGCNCYCTMGGGIAKVIKAQFPDAFAADKKTVSGEKSKLGSYTKARIERDGMAFTIVNAYTQFDWRGTGVKADYDAIEKVFSAIRQEFSGLRIAYPLIGAGLANGDWGRISRIIDQELEGMDHTLVRLPS